MPFNTFVSALAVLLILTLAGVAYQRFGIRRDRLRFPPPGTLLATEGHSLHVQRMGFGRPTVVFEAGLASSSLSWALVQGPAALETRTVSYDRAGIGWSEEATTAPTMRGMVSDLALLLRNAENSGPYILVGHSFGGLLARAFASLRCEEVAGLVLVDPVSLETWAHCSARDRTRLRLGARLSRRGAYLADIGVVRLALAILASGRTRLPKLVARASASKATDLIGRMTEVVRRLPPSLQPVVRSHWSQAKSFRAMAAYLELLPQSAREVQNLQLSSQIPITILSASDATPAELAEREAWAKQSTRGRHIQVHDSRHWIQLENPQAVLGALSDMIAYLQQNNDVTM